VFVKASMLVSKTQDYNKICPFAVHYESVIFYGTGPQASKF